MKNHYITIGVISQATVAGIQHYYQYLLYETAAYLLMIKNQ